MSFGFGMQPAQRVGHFAKNWLRFFALNAPHAAQRLNVRWRDDMILPRRLESEVMDTSSEAEDYDSMDHSAVNRVFASDFLAAWSGGNPVLDVGTGTAQIPIELCRRDERPVVTAIDLS